jgi:hypothetical protein
MDIGVFIPIGNNGWLISTTSPQYKPSFDLNLAVVQKAEQYGFKFALSMIKLRGFGGKSEFWDHTIDGCRGRSSMGRRGCERREGVPCVTERNTRVLCRV